MSIKKDELSEKDIKKENEDLSASQLSDVSGGDAMYLEPKEDGRLLNPEGGDDGRLLNPQEVEDGTFLSPDGHPAGMVMDGDNRKSHILPENTTDLS